MCLRKGRLKGEGHSDGKVRRFRNQIATVLPQQRKNIISCASCVGIQNPQMVGLETKEIRR